MMDLSDGLLLDARRMAEASGCAARIRIDALPLSDAFVAARGDSLHDRLFAATGGDDYALLAALPADLDPLSLSLPSGATIRPIGTLESAGPAVGITMGGKPVALPERLGHEHDGNLASPLGDRA